MSALRLRTHLQRHRRRAAIVLALLGMSGVVALHHAAVAESHGAPGGMSSMSMHAGHVAAQVADGAADVMGVCLAVLPLLLALLVAAAAVLVAFRPAGLRGLRGPPLPWTGLRDRRIRAGPAFLCVMRC